MPQDQNDVSFDVALVVHGIRPDVALVVDAYVDRIGVVDN